jgi:hypothetical protein
LKEMALATRPDWDWRCPFELHARAVDALAEGRMPDEEPPDIVLLTALWMGDSPDVAKLLDGLGYNLSALRGGERGVVKEQLRQHLREILTSALYVSKGDMVPDGLRTEPFPEIAEKVQGRQRREALSELPQAERDRVKQKGQRKLGFKSYDSAIQDLIAKPLSEELSTASSVLNELVEKIVPKLSPAQRDAFLQARDAALQDRDLADYWGGKDSKEYRRKIKAYERAKKCIKDIASSF